MKSIKILSALLALLAISAIIFFSGCVNWVKTIKFKHYVHAYSVSNNFIIKTEEATSPGMFILTLATSKRDFVFFNSEGKDLELFEQLSAKNGDLSYNKKVDYIGGYFMHHRFLSKTIKDLQITCNVDIDKEHSAGTSLNDLFLILSGSPDAFIKSGYQTLNISPTDENMDERFKGVRSSLLYDLGIEKNSSQPIYGKVSDIDYSKYKLLGLHSSEIAYLGWINPPVNLPEYELTVKIMFEDGDSRTASISVAP